MRDIVLCRMARLTLWKSLMFVSMLLGGVNVDRAGGRQDKSGAVSEAVRGISCGDCAKEERC